MTGRPVLDHEVAALEFLGTIGAHRIGVVDDMDKLAAATTFAGLRDRQFVTMSGVGEDAIWSLSLAGQAVPRRLRDR